MGTKNKIIFAFAFITLNILFTKLILYIGETI